MSADNLIALRAARPGWLSEHLHSACDRERLLVIALSARGTANLLGGAVDAGQLAQRLEQARVDGLQRTGPGTATVVFGPAGMWISDPLVVLRRDADPAHAFCSVDVAPRGRSHLADDITAPLTATHRQLLDISFDL